MPDSLLVTKLFIPVTKPELVHRQYLIERLDEGLERKLTLISAPAGFGKTTLVSTWVDNLQKDTSQGQLDKIAWVSLDEADNDPIQFLSYFIAALVKAEAIDTTFGNGMQNMLQTPQPLPPDGILTSLINEISSSPDRIFLILDDYHLIDAQPIHIALTFLLEHLPPQVHLVIATREDPHLPLARLRARGQLSELRANDLRFTSTEAAEFLNHVMGLDLTIDDIGALEERTEGWIAGLQLAAISMQSSQDAKGFIRSFAGSNRYILDYLIEEVLEQQPESIQAFMLETAILERLNGGLCDAVTGQKKGHETLEMLDRTNLFVIPLDDERQWYRYHHLFADLLLQRLHQTQPDKIPLLHNKAGEWFNRQGMNRVAIKHSLAAWDYQRAAELISAIAIDVMQQGEHTTVAGWVNNIPDEIVREQPYLCVLHAWALQLTGQLESAKARLIDAENALDNLGSQDDVDIDTILGLIHSHRAYQSFMFGEHDKTIAYANRALDKLPDTAALIRAQTGLYLGVAYRYQGQIRAAMDTYNKILPITQKMGGKSIAVLCYLHVGDLNTEMAKLHRAKELYEQALIVTEQYSGRPDMPFCGYVYVSIGRILRQWNQLEDAYLNTAKGLALCRDWNVADILALSYIEMAEIEGARGNAEKAQKSFQEATTIMNSISPWGSKIAAAHQAKADLARGDIGAAERWAEANKLVIDSDFEFHREIEYLALARVFIAKKQFEEASTMVEQIYQVAQEIGKRRLELEGLILLALVFSTKGEKDKALDYLEKALTIGEPEGFTRIFVDEGSPMASLLYEALASGLSPDYVQQLLEAFHIEEMGKEPSLQIQSPDSALIEPLSERELEVLQLLAEGLTNQEIANRLYLSQHTVKVHARNIYGKLGVSNRAQAGAKARAFGLLYPH